VALSFLSSLRKLAHFIAFGITPTLCPIYLGEIRHRKVRHPGQHAAIIDRAVWDKVQERLRTRAAHHRTIDRGALPSSLAGKLFDEGGEPLYACGPRCPRRELQFAFDANSVEYPVCPRGIVKLKPEKFGKLAVRVERRKEAVRQ
jgi:hypothetical protein